MRFVPLQERDQQELQAVHRARERVVKARTALVHAIRELLGPYGLLPQRVTTSAARSWWLGQLVARGDKAWGAGANQRTRVAWTLLQTGERSQQGARRQAQGPSAKRRPMLSAKPAYSGSALATG